MQAISSQRLRKKCHQRRRENLPHLYLSSPGSGAGWNTTLSQENNFTAAMHAIFTADQEPNPAGFSADFGWTGGWGCAPDAEQYGGFPGGGGGCAGGGGGAGFIGA